MRLVWEWAFSDSSVALDLWNTLFLRFWGVLNSAWRYSEPESNPVYLASEDPVEVDPESEEEDIVRAVWIKYAGESFADGGKL